MPPAILLVLCIRILSVQPLRSDGNLIADPSFEITKPKDSAGRVFAKWEGWIFEGDCKFEVGLVAHSGKTSALLSCAAAGKIRINQPQELAPGRYRITAYLRGLDIATGQWNQTTEFMFNDKYMNLTKNGNFGWSRMTYVADLAAKTKTGPSFGLWAPGMLWIDDVSMTMVGNDVPVTPAPVIEKEESPIAPPGPLGPGVVHCPRCRYRNMPAWEKCYACGTRLATETKAAPAGPTVKPITSFESGNPFQPGEVTAAHATDGAKALRIDRGYTTMQAPQDWSGYDLLKIDTYTDSREPLPLTIEIHDSGTTDYWTRVNYNTVAPPGRATLVLPLKQIYVGEKSRPGRNLILNGITKLVFSIGDAPAPLFVDNLRLERDESGRKAFFDGLYAFDFGNGPLMDGFTAITPATLYNEGRGYGLRNAKIWRAFDVLEPDPLYEDFLSIEAGGLRVDVPNGKYRVFVNMDSPAGFWGEVQVYTERSVTAQGKTVVSEHQDLKSFLKKYFQFWDKDDLPAENVFDKYDRGHFSEKTFDVDVTNGHLDVDFQGQNWACSISAVVIFPVAKAAEGARFLQWVREKRRFYFDNAFKRVLHTATGDGLKPSAEDQRRGYVIFHRDYMRDLYYNDTPLRDEVGGSASGSAFAGQDEPVAIGVIPLKDLGVATVTASALSAPGGTIPASAIDVGYVSYRLSRVTLEGSVYAITPRYVMPRNRVAMPPGIAREFWMTVHTPAAAAAGVYAGHVTFTPQHGEAISMPIRFTVWKGSLDAVDIPAGPWGGRMGVPWMEGDPEAASIGAALTEKSLHLLRAAGFTMFSGVPYIPFHGFQGGKPVLDFAVADRQMATAREMGFLAVNTYGAGLQGLNLYGEDLDQMKAAGFQDYSVFVKAVFSAIEQHAKEKNWLPLYWNIGDEPSGDGLKGSIDNAAALRKAFPSGPPFFTIPTSLYGHAANEPHFVLAKTVHVANLNIHDEPGIRALLDQGGQWAFYNEGSRWTYGEYLYKAAREFHLKFRLAWHWNLVGGDPYYALDCREDDFAWANTNPEGQLVPSLEFVKISAGLTDYRYLITLARLAKEHAGTPPARAAEDLIARRMAAFRLGDRKREPRPEEWMAFRQAAAAAIVALRQ